VHVRGDFANLPGEVEASVAVLAAAAPLPENDRRPLTVLMTTGNPDNNSQWLTRIDDFAAALLPADRIVLTDRNNPDGMGPIAADLLRALRERGHTDVRFIPFNGWTSAMGEGRSLMQVLVDDVLEAGDRCLVAGAGVADVAQELAAGLSVEECRRIRELDRATHW